MLTEKFVRTTELALKLHATQLRKGSQIPYTSHLLGVASLVLENGGDEEQAIAGLLHDAIEDFGPEAMLTDCLHPDDALYARKAQLEFPVVAPIVAQLTGG
jgi:hypothetical protein